MTPAQLATRLNDTAETICKHLLPAGKKVGNEWCAGDAYGGEGRSLKIVLEGTKVGIGSDFATGETFGDLLDVWQVTQGCGLAEAMTQACSFIGIVNDGNDSKPKKEYKRPERPKLVRRLNREGQVYAYLKTRGLTDQALEDFRIAEENDQWIVFPYLREDGHINTKYIHIERDEKGKKQCRQEQGAEPCLFGWHALEAKYPNTRFTCLTEGEIDTITLHQCGVPSLSIPNGGGGGNKQNWIDQDYDRLNRFDTIYLCMDNDEAGKEAEQEIIRRLGCERIRLVKLPFKDANECFKNNIKSFQKYLLSARSLDPDELKSADSFMDEVIDKFYPKPGSFKGMKTPWASINNAISFQRKELILWTGFSGSGKSTVLNQVAMNGLLNGEKFVIASLEMPARVTLWQMVRQLSGCQSPPQDDIRRIMKWLGDKLWLFDMTGTAKTQRLLEVFKYAVKRYDIRNFVTDSLTKCGIADDDLNGQKKFIEQLCDFGNQFDCTNHLVVHQRKPDNESARPGKFGVRGSTAMTDEAHTVLSVWRYAENEFEEESRFKKKKNEPEVEKPDTVLSILKNRETGVLGKFNLFFEPMSLQFSEMRSLTGIRYLDRAEEDKVDIF